MAGFVFCPINRVLAIEPDDDASLTVGTAIVTGYPLENLTDPAHWNQCRITTAAGAFRLRFTFGTPADSGDTDYMVNALGFVNHNLDGATITLKYGSTTTYADATLVTNMPIILDNAVSNPDLLFTFTGVAATYWFLDVTGAGVTAAIGQIVLGYAFDFGTPATGENRDPIPLHEPTMTAGGYEVPTKLTEPAVTFSGAFRNPANLPSTSVYDKSLESGGDYPTYVTLERAFNGLRLIDHGGSVTTGIGAAGGAVPILYHEGTVNGVNLVGRPAHYGYVRAQFSRNDLRNTMSTAVVTIRDANPRAVDLAPADGLTYDQADIETTASAVVTFGLVAP